MKVRVLPSHPLPSGKGIGNTTTDTGGGVRPSFREKQGIRGIHTQGTPICHTKVKGIKVLVALIKCTYIHIPLSTLVLNIRNRHESIWFPKRMHLDKQHYKNQNMIKPTSTLYVTTALTMLYLHSNKPKAATFIH